LHSAKKCYNKVSNYDHLASSEFLLKKLEK
jgi:hypothetical protein